MNTETAAGLVKEALNESIRPAKIVFMFGAVATGYDDEKEEKNLVLIGEGLDVEAIEKELGDLKEKIEPSLTISTFNHHEFAKSFLGGKLFIRKSANAPKTFIKGKDDDLWRLYYEAEV